jgi:hypothetical protein
MVGETFAGLSALKSAFDIAKGLKDIDNAARRNAAVIELQEKILAAQSAQSDLTERIRALEEKVADFETWETEKERYQLHKTAGGGFVWSLKNETESRELPHQICARCYEDRKRSILQPKPRSIAAVQHAGWPALICPVCKSEVPS